MSIKPYVTQLNYKTYVEYIIIVSFQKIIDKLIAIETLRKNFMLLTSSFNGVYGRRGAVGYSIFK